MYYSSDRTVSEIKAIHASVHRAEGKVDLHYVSRELVYRAIMMKGISQTTAVSVSDGLIVRREN